MSQFAIQPHDVARLSALDERTAEAWTAYRDATQGLEGPDYAEAEHDAWAALQDDLRAIADERSALAEAA
jgi:hypothetical protein